MNLIAERQTDNLGRIVLPQELRIKLDIPGGTVLGIYEDDDKIILQKAVPSCKLCGSTENIDDELALCRECIYRIKNVRDTL